MKYHFTGYRYHLLVLSLIAVLFSSCLDLSNKPENVALSDTLELRENGNIHDTATVVFAISSMTTPRETYIYYNDLLDYFSIKTGKEVSLKQRKTYKETNDMITKGEVDIAFICTGAFINSKDDSSSHLIVVPVINGHPFYQAYIITHVNSGISKFEDLKGKKFAYTDPLSNTGYFYPQYRLQQLSTTDEKFFSTTLYTYAHDLSIELINNNIVSAASVDGLIFDYLAKQKPGKVKNIKIIEKSEPFGMPPIVAPTTLSDQTFDQYQKVFLSMHKNKEGKAILEKLNIDSFIIVGDTLYSSAKKLKSCLDATN